MFAAGLHARGRDRPNLGIEIKFIPPRAKYLAGAARRQDQEFESQRRHGFPLSKLADEFRHVIEGHGRMMTARELLALWQDEGQVAAPGRRVLTGTPAVRFCEVKHRLDAPAQS